MRRFFYPRLAWEGIGKNSRLYVPYILTGCTMVMMYYILSSLTESPALAQMRGGSVLMSMLPLGCVVVALFSVLFLFYTNSFLIRQRYREFGLYNILGMDKGNISRIMLWESVFVAALAIGLGLVLGMALSKIAELVLLNLLGMPISYKLSVGATSLVQTSLVFGGIYLLLLGNSVLRVGFSKPLELMRSNRVGERVLKRTWLYALAGVVCLIAAYYLALAIEEPLEAVFWFFVAVLLVIVGTYLVFIAGSVVFCRLLQANKNYYYRPNHFISVGSMVYRMKRNGAGLASICILLTMVLVMISSTACLYFGAEDSLKRRCPNSVNVTAAFDRLDAISDARLDALRQAIRAETGIDDPLTGVRSAEVYGLITPSGLLIDVENAPDTTIFSYGQMGYLSVVSLADYNAAMGTDWTLEEQECLLYCDRLSFQWDSFTMEYGKSYQVKARLAEFPEDGSTMTLMVPIVYLVVEELPAFVRPVERMTTDLGDPLVVYHWYFGFDTDTPEAEQAAADCIQALWESMAAQEDTGLFSFIVRGRAYQRSSFYDMYGSLLFLGIMLSIVFLMAAVLIIYYKQISEGFEDQARFGILQRVGMTRQDIRRSINSQMLTVFFLPLLFAGIHLSFAFPFLTKIFQMFAFDNTLLSILVDLSCFGVFGIFYALVYKITSGAYYAIVSRL